MPLRHLHDPLVLVVVGLAVYRLTRLLTVDVILERPRAAITRRGGPLAYLVGCPWCLSVWVAAVAVVGVALLPVIVTLLIAVPLAWSAAAGLLSSWE